MADVQAPADSRCAKVLLGTTPNGKEIYLVRVPNKSVRNIAFGSGGQLPPQLEGGFSSVAAATKVVDSYIAKLEAKEIDASGKKLKK